jgi:Ca-activated chloride channel family protein
MHAMKWVLSSSLVAFFCFTPPCFAQIQSVAARPALDIPVAITAPKEQRDHVASPARQEAGSLPGRARKENAELSFDPATQTVTVKVQVLDPSGDAIPNVRRENFAVFENGVRPKNVSVEVEHAPLSLAVLMEWGGRYPAFNRALGDEAPRAVRQILEEIGGRDKIALFRYGDRFEQLADFTTGHDTLSGLLIGLGRPDFSELNFYDALVSTANFMKGVKGRKAILLISSGVDTFSRATFEDALATVKDCGTPVYVMNIGPALRRSVSYSSGITAPYVRIDWNRAETQLQEIAEASGGRLYSVESTFDLAGIYDALMESLRVRYVITYPTTADTGPQTARTVRIELVDPATGGPLKVLDANGEPLQASLAFESSYVPSHAVVSQNVAVKQQ